MLAVVPFAERREGVGGIRAAEHGAHHGCDELVNAKTLLDEWDKSSDTAFVVVGSTEMRKDEFLERVNLILKSHEVRNRLVSLVGVVDSFEGDELLVLEETVEFWMVAVEAKLGEEEGRVCAD